MTQIDLKGMGVALITPFKSDGNIDKPALLRLVKEQLQSGTDYLVLLGTTAETPTLTMEEQREIIRWVVAENNRRVPLIVGVGGNHTQAVVQKLLSENFTGIDAILSVVPYYNKPTQEGIYQHYKNIAQATSLPLILYNVPGRTGINMTDQTTLRLAFDFENIVAIKEASGNTDQIREIIKSKPNHFQVISGDDGLALDWMEIGAVGVISVFGNAFPKMFGQMVHLALQKDYTRARILHNQFSKLLDLLFIDGNPAGIKCMLHIMNDMENQLRLPLVPVQQTTYEKIKQALLMFRTQ